VIRAAVLGSPIAHSLSPFIHMRAYEILGIEGMYEKFDLGIEEFAAFSEEAKSNGWTGFSLTMPLKEVAFSSGFSIDPRATKIHSANTLIRTGNSYHALSTDVLAFDRILKNLDFQRVAVIGGGGTARAALGALDGRAEEIDVLLRNTSREAQLSACVEFVSLNFLPMESNLDGYDLLISTTPAGATDAIAQSLRVANGTLIEALYKPWPTNFSARWLELGGNVVHGLDLLVEQALDQIHLMTNISFDFSVMRSTLLSEVISHQKG